jgi:hypothetical protein
MGWGLAVPGRFRAWPPPDPPCPAPTFVPPAHAEQRWGSVASGQAASLHSRPRTSSTLLYYIILMPNAVPYCAVPHRAYPQVLGEELKKFSRYSYPDMTKTQGNFTLQVRPPNAGSELELYDTTVVATSIWISKFRMGLLNDGRLDFYIFEIRMDLSYTVESHCLRFLLIILGRNGSGNYYFWLKTGRLKKCFRPKEAQTGLKLGKTKKKRKN